MTIVTVGLDIAKQIFQVHGVDRTGKVVVRKGLRRIEVAPFFAEREPGWRTRSVFERYAIVSRTDMADAILKLQESERRAEDELQQKQDDETQQGLASAHDNVSSNRTVARTRVN